MTIIIYLYTTCIRLMTFLHRYATEVDVDFVRKSVRAIGRCAIKVEVSEKEDSGRIPKNSAI